MCAWSLSLFFLTWTTLDVGTRSVRGGMRFIKNDVGISSLSKIDRWSLGFLSPLGGRFIPMPDLVPESQAFLLRVVRYHLAEHVSLNPLGKEATSAW